MKIRLLTLMLCLCTGNLFAQQLSHTFNDISFSEALKYIQSQTNDYSISFIYNDLEDFRVTTELKEASVPDAIQQIIGYYPIEMRMSDNSIYVECTDKAERHLTGILIDEKKRPVAYASVVLLHPADSTMITYGVSNESGKFVIPFHQSEVVVAFSCMGYKKQYRTCHTEDMGIIQLQSEEYFINGVVVKGEHILHYVDKSVHTFTNEQIGMARNVRDLLQYVQDLEIDPISNHIKRRNGESVTLLLNGIRASDIDLKSIPPDKIVRVEYYDIPPARYSDAGIVVNVITKRLDDGFSMGTDLTHAFTTGFGNDDAYFSYTSGHHQLQAGYSLNLREYSDDQGHTSYDYMLGGNSYNYNEHHQRAFGYRTHEPHVKYTYNRPEDLIVQVNVTPSSVTMHENRHVDIDILQEGTLTKGEGQSHTHERYFNPSLNSYIRKTLPHHQELEADLTFTYYRNNYEYDTEKHYLADGSTLLDDQQRQKSDKRSIIGEVAYTKQWNQHSLRAGYRSSFGKSTATLSNILSDYADYTYSSASAFNYLYAQLNGRFGKVGYLLSIGATHVHNINDDTSTKQWRIIPRLTFNYNPSSTTSLQWITAMGTYTPAISQLSNNTTLTLPHVLSTGNPYLRNSTSLNNLLQFQWNTQMLSLSLTLSHQYVDAPVSTYYTEQQMMDKRYIVGRSENANFSSDFAFSYSFTFKPFKSELLTIGASGSVNHQTLDSPIVGRYHKTHTPFWFSITFRYGPWGAYYRGHIISHSLSGSHLSSGENESDLFAFWQKNGWRITAGCYWIGTRAQYSSYNLPTNILHTQQKNWINDNASMVILGVSWDFTTGKKFRIQRSIQNRDNDSGRF